jgi:CheY-like chemotaxis protein
MCRATPGTILTVSMVDTLRLALDIRFHELPCVRMERANSSVFYCNISVQEQMGEVEMIKLLLVDDQTMVRRGLRMRLVLEPDIIIVGEASNGKEAVELVQSLGPDVVLMDVEMPGMDGITATAAVHATNPQSAVVMLSIHDDSATRARAQHAGAVAFVEKRGTTEVLLAAIRQAASK